MKTFITKLDLLKCGLLCLLLTPAICVAAADEFVSWLYCRTWRS